MFWVYCIQAGTNPGPDIADNGITNGLFVQMTIINGSLDQSSVEFWEHEM